MLDFPNSAPRRPRFRRHRFGKPTFALTDRDRQIVQLVAEFRLLTSDQVQLLVGGSAQNILRRLQVLFHAGLLDRPRQQTLRRNEKFVYALGQAGAELLNQSAPARRWVGDFSEKNRQIGLPYIEHALMLAKFRATLTLAARSCDVGLQRWIQGDDIRDHVLVDGGHGQERLPVCPDALFTLRLLNEPDGRNHVHVLLEADRGTMTVKRFTEKLHAYWAYWRSGRQEEKFGFKNFLMATITRTPERARNLLEATRQVDAPRGRGLRMFIFASETEYSPAAPASVLSAIWVTPADDGRHTLVE